MRIERQSHDIEDHIHTSRFKIYMAAWSIFFTVIVGMTLNGNLRGYLQGPSAERQVVELARAQKP